RKTDKPHVGHHFHLKNQVPFLTFFPILRNLRRRIIRRCEPYVPATATSASCYDDALPMTRQIRHDLSRILVGYDRSGRYLHDQIFRIRAMLIFRLALLADRCFEMALIAEVHQRTEPLLHLEYHIAAMSSVTAGRTAVRHIKLSAERNNA